jgi:hypothetical protein
MTKNTEKMQFQCNQSPVRVRGLFLAKGYRGYREIHNFPQWIFTTLNFPLFYFTLCKVFVFLCFLCNFNWLAQACTGLHWNFFLCNREAKNRRNPKPSKGYTGIEALCNLLLIKKQIK